jgi:NAD(P)-dependent dehydrogenase (short-subunit alcohol dehydrogenase family)
MVMPAHDDPFFGGERGQRTPPRRNRGPRRKCVLPGPRRRVFDIVVSNAAHQHAVDRIEDISTDQFDTTFKTNVYTMF